MRYKINLLLPKEVTIFDRIIYFSLHYLRYILVITQIIVITVFFYRFKIDQQIIDLKDELDQKQEIVLVSSPLIKQAEATDIKIRELKQIIRNQDSTNQMMNYFLLIFPEEMQLSKLIIKEGLMEFTGQSANANIFKIFYERLRKDKRFKTVNLISIKKINLQYEADFKLADFIYK